MSTHIRAVARHIRHLATRAQDLYQCSLCGQWSTEPAQICSACR